MEAQCDVRFKNDSHIVFEDDSEVSITIQEIIRQDGYGQVSVLKAVLPDAPDFQNSHGEKESKTVAIKCFRPRIRRQVESISAAFHRERLNLLSIKHVRIVSILATFEVKGLKLGHFDLILPYADRGDLDGFLHTSRSPAWLQKHRKRTFDGDINAGFCSFEMDRGERVCIYRNLIALFEALAFLHHSSDEMFVIHRDIMLHNILIFGEYFKISDFGHPGLKDLDETSKTEWLAGTPMYAPPERANPLLHHGRAREVWAFGCVLLEVLVLIAFVGIIR